jgi:hypothetical protein
MMNEDIQKLHDSYKSPDARIAVEYMWDIAMIDWTTGDVAFEKAQEIIKYIADNVETLYNSAHSMKGTYEQ